MSTPLSAAGTVTIMARFMDRLGENCPSSVPEKISRLVTKLSILLPEELEPPEEPPEGRFKMVRVSIVPPPLFHTKSSPKNIF